MSSSGLIYAVIVGAWAAYLVPMWLRRQDELNEARPTERFSTAIRLLSGRAAMERRYAKDLKDLEERHSDDADDTVDAAEPEQGAADPDAPTDAVDVRAFAMSAVMPVPEGLRTDDEAGPVPDRAPPAERRAPHSPSVAERARRSKALARRRLTTMVLFLAFALGAIVAAVGGLAFLWAPAVPAILLSTYIIHLRAQERRRFAFTMDRRRAEAAAKRLRERGPRKPAPPAAGEAAAAARGAGPAAQDGPVPAQTRPSSPSPASPHTAGRRALVEQTDHAEWVDQQRERGPAEGESWDPVPVPLPTYVTAPVAPRATGSVDLDAPDAWSSARSSAAEPAAATAPPEPAPAPRPGRPERARRTRDRGRTPLFDQYAEEDRPRAANE